MPTNISKGTAYALGACFIWGLIFIVPLYMEGFTTIEIALGRYLTYGMISLVILLRTYFQGTYSYPLGIWVKAIGFSFACTMNYYIFVILSVRYSTPAICALILGIAPISIAFYGNWRHKECSYQSLIMPSLLVLLGLIVINAPYIIETPAASTHLLGVFCALWALMAWSWYVVENSAFLKKNPEIDSGNWSTLIGVSTLFWVFVLGAVTTVFFEEQLDFNKYIQPGPQLVHFLAGCAVLGFLCSWLGAYLWNKASLYLPVSLAGQLMVFETLFGISFVYGLDQSLPPEIEFLGMTFLLIAIIYGIRVSSHAHHGKAVIST